jgi:hypothetical protein
MRRSGCGWRRGTEKSPPSFPQLPVHLVVRAKLRIMKPVCTAWCGISRVPVWQGKISGAGSGERRTTFRGAHSFRCLV